MKHNLRNRLTDQSFIAAGRIVNKRIVNKPKKGTTLKIVPFAG